MVKLTDFGDFHDLSTDDKKYFLIDTIPDICLDDNTPPGHIDALFYSYLGATCQDFPPLIRETFDRLFTAVEEGNYDVAALLFSKQKEMDVYMAQIGYKNPEAGD